MSNGAALHDFVEFHDLDRDSFGRCRFTADVTIRAGGRGGAETMPARISFASGDREQLSLEGGSVLKPGEVPLGYSIDYGEWSHEDGTLTISGSYRRMFDYVTEITVER